MNERYSRQILFREIGREGQEKLLNSRVLIVGCGALGASHAEMLARAGVGKLRIVHLRLFQTRLQNDLLVVYDEYSDRNDAIRTRAYLLNQNQKRLEQCQPPHFVSINRWRGLTPVAVLPGSNSPAAFFASVETNGQSFTIYSRNRPVHSYPLPVYNDGKARLARIVLTPVALTADLTIIGGYLFLYAWASGALNCVH